MVISKKGKVRPFRNIAEQFDENILKKKWSLIFKILILLSCATGFVYQLWVFVEMYLTYPTSVDFEVQHPDFVEMPAITLCDTNPIRRTPYCLDNPEKCRMTSRGEEVCESDPELCKNETFMTYYKILNLDYIGDALCVGNMNLSDKYGVMPHHMIKSCTVSWAPDFNLCQEEYLEQTYMLTAEEVCSNCWVINSRARKPPTKVSYMPLASQSQGNYLRVILDTNPQEIFYVMSNSVIYAEIHSPYHFIDIMTCGKILKPGYSYEFQLKIGEMNFLKAPFSSNCTDYEEKWEKTRKYADRSQEACIDSCIIEMAQTQCDCFPLVVTTFRDEMRDKPLCIRTENLSACVNQIETSRCRGQCNMGCRYTTYEKSLHTSLFSNQPENTDYVDPDFGLHNVGVDQEEETENYYIPIRHENQLYENRFSKERYIEVTLKLKTRDLTVFALKPKFATIELFSYIGGYIGMWIGFALVEASDLLDLFFHYKERQASKQE